MGRWRGRPILNTFKQFHGGQYCQRDLHAKKYSCQKLYSKKYRVGPVGQDKRIIQLHNEMIQ